MRRHIRPGHNGTVVPTPHASRLKRGTLKSYVRAVPSRASSARPPAAPEPSSRAVPFGRGLRLDRPRRRNQSETSRGKNPQAMATYVLEVARLTHQMGSNSRLRMTKEGMTEDEHNRSHGPSPLGDRRVLTSRIRGPCGCHVSGIPSREAPSPQNLSNGFDIHRDCPRVFLRCAHRATSRPLSNGTRACTWIYLLAALGERRYSPIEGSTVPPTPPPIERMNEGRNYKTRKNTIDPCGERARGLPRTRGTGTACEEHVTYPLNTPNYNIQG